MAIHIGQPAAPYLPASPDIRPADYDFSDSWENYSGDQREGYYPLVLGLGQDWPSEVVIGPRGVKRNLDTYRKIAIHQFVKRVHTFTDLFYGRIQLDPSYLNLGNILNSQSREVEMWNATFFPITVTGYTATGEDGTELIGLTLPVVLQPLQAINFDVGISTQGPVQVDARYTFLATGANGVALQVVGTRVVVFSLPPDTSQDYIERMEWISDVITSYDGTEQRASLLEVPDVGIRYTVRSHSQAIHYLDSLLWGWQHRIYAVPLWHRGEKLAVTATQGSTTVMVPTTYAGFRVGGLIMLWSEYSNFEASEIESIEVDRVQLKRPLQKTWPGRTLAVACRSARLPQEIQTNWQTSDFGTSTVDFWLTEAEEEAPLDTGLTYRGRPLMMTAPNWIDGLTEQQVRNLDVFETTTKARFTKLKNEVPYIVRGFSWFLKDKENIHKFRQWLYARRGRTVPFWSPSWKADMEIAAKAEEGATSLRIKPIGFSQLYTYNDGRQDIAIFLKNGQVLLRRILSAGLGSDGLETLGMDAEFTDPVEISDVRMISYLGQYRLDADAVEMAWKSDKLTLCTQNMRLLTDGV